MAMDTWSAVEMLRLPGALPGYMRRAARTRTPRFGGGGAGEGGGGTVG